MYRRWLLGGLAILTLVMLAGLLLGSADRPAEATAEGASGVAAGSLRHACALTTVGGVKCWGRNDFGQLGDGQVCGTPCATPVDVCADAGCASPLTGVTAVSAGFTHTCALTTLSVVKCWGENSSGELGDGQACGIICSTPVDTCADATCAGPLTGIDAVSAGGRFLPPVGGEIEGLGHTCALTTAGSMKCWGYNLFGQLGDGTTASSATPVDVCADETCAAPLTGATSVSTGIGHKSGGHTCALTTASGVKCWGANLFGELGDGTTTDSPTPVDVCPDTACAEPITSIAAVSAGGGHTCLLTAAGEVQCWGSNCCGQLGDGTATTRFTPGDVCADVNCTAALADVTDISTGQSYTCALTAPGGVKCWGANLDGRLGDGTTTRRHTPVAVCADADCASPLTGVTVVSAGHSTCAVTAANGVKCWGWNEDGQLGAPTTEVCFFVETACSTTPIDVVGLEAKSIGGIAQLPGDATVPLDIADSSGGNRGSVLAITALIGAVVVVLASGAWYARRRALR